MIYPGFPLILFRGQPEYSFEHVLAFPPRVSLMRTYISNVTPRAGRVGTLICFVSGLSCPPTDEIARMQ